MKIIQYSDFIKESSSYMKYYLPTYEECREICDANDNFIFYEIKTEIDGYKISIFNNRLAQPSDFIVDFLEFEENGVKIIINGNIIYNGKKLKEYSDKELDMIGFQKLSEFEI